MTWCWPTKNGCFGGLLLASGFSGISGFCGTKCATMILGEKTSQKS